MSPLAQRIPLLLREYETRQFERAELPEEVGETLFRQYGEQVRVEWPTPATEHRWRLTSLGWVGYIPLGETHLLELAPRVPVSNLLGMLEYAYGLRSFQILKGDIRTTSLADFYERLAEVLARRIRTRLRLGLHRAYVALTEALPCVRGRLDIAELLRAPWRLEVPCSFDEHTADVDDNAILAWTMDRILRSGLCSDRTLPHLRDVHQRLRGHVRLRPFTGADCAARTYSRLDADYEPLHRLCRFFLDSCGPSHEWGDRWMLPFTLHMPRLFESFVAAWLAEHASSIFRVIPQHRIEVGTGAALAFRADVVLADRSSPQSLAVLDTKYKLDGVPSTDDVAQVVTYAQALGCPLGVLVYPQVVPPHRFRIGGTTVAMVGLPLSEELEAAGGHFLGELGLLLGTTAL